MNALQFAQHSNASAYLPGAASNGTSRNIDAATQFPGGVRVRRVGAVHYAAAVHRTG